MSRYDALVVGGGPAGCAAALYAARAGLKVALVDRATFPRPKACGEGLMPSGGDVLRELGLWEHVVPHGAPFAGVRYTTGAGRAAQGRFPGGRRGLGIRRDDLDHVLWRAAASARGVDAYEGRDGDGLSARFVAVCDGGRSKAAAAFGCRRDGPARRRFGLSARFEGLAAGDALVEVFLSRAAELYLTPLPDGHATLAALLDETALTGAPESVYDALIAACPALLARLGTARRSTPVRGLGPLAQRASPITGPAWLLAGDAAGALDPIIGDGVAAALETGRLAGKALASAVSGDARALKRYEAQRQALLRPRRWLASAVLTAARRPVVAETVVAGLGRFPRAFDAVLSLF